MVADTPVLTVVQNGEEGRIVYAHKRRTVVGLAMDDQALELLKPLLNIALLHCLAGPYLHRGDRTTSIPGVAMSTSAEIILGERKLANGAMGIGDRIQSSWVEP
jgi:hypothetical protein